MAGDLEVRTPTRRDRRAAVAVLAQALLDDPGWTSVVPDRGRRGVVLHGLLAAVVADSGSHARVAVRRGAVLGAAVWQPPGRFPMTWWRQARTAPRIVLPAAVLGREVRAVARLGAAVDAAFPQKAVRYLQVLGVSPDAQRQGVGAALLREGLDRADAAREETYLETAEEDNVAYYQHWGFGLEAPGGPISDGGPVMWRMLRPPTTR